MRLFQLKIGADIVAIRVGFVVGDSVYLYYSGFDPAWARYSVMTTTLAEALKYAMAAGLKTANLSLSPDQSKLRWRPRVVEYHSASVRRDRLISRIAHRVYLGALETLRTDRGVQARLLRSLVRARRDWD
jgi:CelD/BcsL family acetyltransferase involved in cellulose biosynthesis